jgi:hypothetical protein
MRRGLGLTAALALLLSATPSATAVAGTPSVAVVCPTFSGPGPLAGIPTNTVYLPNITKTLGGPSGWVTPFIVQNIDAVGTNLELNFYRFSDGCLVTRRVVNGLQPLRSFADIPNNDADLPGDTQFSVVVRSFGGNVVSVVNEVQGSGATFQGLSYAGSTSGAMVVYLPNVTRRFFGYDVPFIIQDLGAAQAHASVRFVSFDGTLTYTMSVSADPQQSAVVDPNFLPAYNGSANSGLRDGTQYAVTVTSDQPVAVVVNAHNETGAPVAYSHNGLTVGAPKVYAPYAAKNADGVGRFSPIVVQNLGTASVSPTLTFTPLASSSSGGGYPASLPNDSPCPVLSLFRCYTFNVTSAGAPLPGVCLAITSASDPNLVGCPNPHYTTNALGVAQVGTLGADADVFFLYPGKATVGPIHVTATGTTAVTMPSGAQQVFSLGPIAAGASKAFDPRFALNTTTPCSGASSTCLGDGVFALVADAPGGQIAMLVLPVSGDTAAAYTATPAPSNKVFLPNVTRTLGGATGYTTPIYLQSAGAATGATVQWFRFSDGQLVVTQTVTMSAGGGAAIDPRTVAGLSDDTQYAVVATGVAGTIYGIVFEQAFTGGDAAFVYEGFPGN